MKIGEFRKVGHWPSLLASFIHFDISFGVWVLLGVLAPFISRELDLSPATTGLVVAVPLLSGAFFRLILGWLSDSFGPRSVGTASMLAVLVPLGLGWRAGGELNQLLAIGFLLGIAGASFAVALPLAASHYPRSHQGLALGIAGAGNSGTVLAGLMAPRIADHIGWHNTMGVAMIPVLAAAIAFRLMAKEGAARRGHSRFLAAFAPLRQADCWRVCGFYAMTFGGFVGLASYLPSLMVSRYQISAVAAGGFAAAAGGLGSLMRPVGGSLADRWGGSRVLLWVFVAAGALAIGMAIPGGLILGVAFAIPLMGLLGAGNGAVFQMVSMRFSSNIGLVTGIVGAAGGIGGFLMPTVLGSIRQQTGSYTLGFALFAALALFLAAPAVMALRTRWAGMGNLDVSEAGA